MGQLIKMSLRLPFPHSGKKPTGGSWGMFHTNFSFFSSHSHVFLLRIKKKNPAVVILISPRVFFFAGGGLGGVRLVHSVSS